jgi:hypothetical protein
MSHLKAKLGKKLTCAICGNVYEDGSRKIGVFSVPKNMFSRGNQSFKLKETARLCDIHFEESDIVKGFKNGQNCHPLKNWRLLCQLFQNLSWVTLQMYYSQFTM